MLDGRLNGSINGPLDSSLNQCLLMTHLINMKLSINVTLDDMFSVPIMWALRVKMALWKNTLHNIC